VNGPKLKLGEKAEHAQLILTTRVSQFEGGKLNPWSARELILLKDREANL
jgi:hypothetical protein